MFTESLIQLGTSLARHYGRELATISTYAADDGKLFARLQGGASITLRRDARIIQRLSNNWPDCLPWPSDVPRPDPAAPSESESRLKKLKIRHGRCNGSATPTPPPTSADPVAAVKAALKRADDATMDHDWNTVRKARQAAREAGRTLGPDGTLASPEALRLSLAERVRSRKAFYNGYYNVTDNYIDGKDLERKQPKPRWGGMKSATAVILDELLAADDARVALRAQRQATTAGLRGGTLTGVG